MSSLATDVDATTSTSTSLIYVVEHMETEISEWVRNEYTRMIKDVGGEKIMFTNMKPGFNCPSYDSDEMQFLKGATLKPETFQEFHDSNNGDRKKAVLLDEKSETILSPQDAGKFEYFLFGGILGNVDDLDMDRTSELRDQGYTQRHLGKEQMSTPTALAVSYRILEEQTPYDKLEFIDRPEYEITESETLVIPFKYLADEEGKPIMAEGNLELMTQDLDWDLDMLTQKNEQEFSNLSQLSYVTILMVNEFRASSLFVLEAIELKRMMHDNMTEQQTLTKNYGPIRG